MKYLYKIVVIAMLLSVLSLSLPATTFASSETNQINSGEIYAVPLVDAQIQPCPSVKGCFTANATLLVFISNSSGVSYYLTYFKIPPYALWDVNGTSGDWDLSLPGGIPHILVFINNQSVTVQVEYTVPCGNGCGGIPGFELIPVLLMLLVIVAIPHLRKKELVK